MGGNPSGGPDTQRPPEVSQGRDVRTTLSGPTQPLQDQCQAPRMRGQLRRSGGRATGCGWLFGGGGVSSAATARRAVALLALVTMQELCWRAGRAHGMQAGPTHGTGHGHMGPEDAGGRGGVGDAEGFGPEYDQLLASLGDHHNAARKLLTALKPGPLPGLSFIPGFPGGGGLKPPGFSPRDRSFAARIGAATEEAFADYVVKGQDPVAIALRQLSVVTIAAFGTAVQNQIARAIRDCDALLARYEDYLGRVADAMTDSNVENLLAAIQREVRVVVIVRAALEDMGARWAVYVAFLTEAASAWVSWYYGIQFRFTVMLIALQWANDPFALEYVRVLYSLSDLTKLVGLVLSPFITVQEFEQSFYNALNDIIFAYANDERNRLTITPSFSLPWAPGTGGNLQVAIDRVLSVASALRNQDNAAALLRAAVTARDQVAAAFRRPNADGSSNVAGLFQQQAWSGDEMDGVAGGRSRGGVPAGGGGMVGMAGLSNGATSVNMFSAVSNGR